MLIQYSTLASHAVFVDIIKVPLQKQLHQGKNNSNVVFGEYNIFSSTWLKKFLCTDMFVVEFFRKFLVLNQVVTVLSSSGIEKRCHFVKIQATKNIPSSVLFHQNFIFTNSCLQCCFLGLPRPDINNTYFLACLLKNVTQQKDDPCEIWILWHLCFNKGLFLATRQYKLVHL